MSAARAPVKTSPVFVRVPTPLTDAIPFECRALIQDLARELERDCMTMALRLYAEPYSTHSPETMECLDRWKPRVEALLANPETYK
jgi:hypothetical protein